MATPTSSMVTVAVNALSDWWRGKWNHGTVSVGGMQLEGWGGVFDKRFNHMGSEPDTHTHTQTHVIVSLSHADTLTDSYGVSPIESIGMLVISSLTLLERRVLRSAPPPGSDLSGERGLSGANATTKRRKRSDTQTARFSSSQDAFVCRLLKLHTVYEEQLISHSQGSQVAPLLVCCVLNPDVPTVSSGNNYYHELMFFINSIFNWINQHKYTQVRRA